MLQLESLPPSSSSASSASPSGESRIVAILRLVIAGGGTIAFGWHSQSDAERIAALVALIIIAIPTHAGKLIDLLSRVLGGSR